MKLKKTWLTRLVVAAICGATLTWVLPMTAAQVFAHPSVNTAQDPIVIVARDMTAASHCQSFHGIRLTHTSPITSIVYSACPAGAIVHTFEVPRSQAIAHHEAFVQLPPANVRPQQQAQTDQQVIDLVMRLQPSETQNAGIQPNSTCSPFENVVGNSYTLSGVTVYTTVDYQKHADCSITFYDTTAQITSGSTTDTLWKADYNSTVNFPAVCKLFSNTQVADDTNLPGSFSAGHYFHQIDNAGVNCGTSTIGTSSMFVS